MNGPVERPDGGRDGHVLFLKSLEVYDASPKVLNLPAKRAYAIPESGCSIVGKRCDPGRGGRRPVSEQLIQIRNFLTKCSDLASVGDVINSMPGNDDEQ